MFFFFFCLIDPWIDWLIIWLIDWLMDWLVDRSIDRSIDWLIDGWIDELIPVITPSDPFAIVSFQNSACDLSTSFCKDSHRFFAFPSNLTELCDCRANQLSKRFSIRAKSFNLSWLGIGSVIGLSVAYCSKTREDKGGWVNPPYRLYYSQGYPSQVIFRSLPASEISRGSKSINPESN